MSRSSDFFDRLYSAKSWDWDEWIEELREQLANDVLVWTPEEKEAERLHAIDERIAIQEEHLKERI